MTIENRISSLGPPRGGRVVRDAREVIKEIEEYRQRKSLEGEILSSDTQGNNNVVANQPAELLRFKAGAIEVADDYFELKDLDVPEGHWKSLKLLTFPAYEADYKDTWIFWENRSRANLLVPSKGIDGIREHAVLCPFRVFYWFLRAAYELNETQFENTTKFLVFISNLHPKTDLPQDLGESWHFAEAYTRHGDKLHLETKGMDKTHPLYQDLTFEINGPEMLKGSKDYCVNALGDNHSHVQSVLNWYSPRPLTGGVEIRLPAVQNEQKCTSLRFLTDDVNLSLNLLIQATNPAHFVVADPSDFTPNGGRT